MSPARVVTKDSYTKINDGFVLLEALIAILIFSMGILALVGLQGVMIKDTTESKNRADASFIAQRRVAMIWANPVALGTLGEVIDIKELPNGKLTTTIVDATTGAITVTVTWQEPGRPSHTYSVNARITGAT